MNKKTKRIALISIISVLFLVMIYLFFIHDEHADFGALSCVVVASLMGYLCVVWLVTNLTLHRGVKLIRKLQSFVRKDNEQELCSLTLHVSVTIFAILAGALHAFLCVGLIRFGISNMSEQFYYSSNFDVNNDVLRGIGYSEDKDNGFDEPLKDLRDVFETNKDSPAKSDYCFALTKDNDVELINSGGPLLKNMFLEALDNESNSAEKAVGMFKEVIDRREDSEDKIGKLLSAYLKNKFIPGAFFWSSDLRQSPSREILKQVNTCSNEITITIRQEDINDIHKKVLKAYYERMNEKMFPYFRAIMLIYGPIQILTLALFFAGIIIVRARRLQIAREISYMNRNDYSECLAGLSDSKDKCRDLRTMSNDALNLIAHQASQSKVNETGIPLWREANNELYRAIVNDCIENEDGGNVVLVNTLSRLDKYYSDIQDRLDGVEYSVIDYIIWAMPSLGFIGTVVGIGSALGSADQVVRATDSIGQAGAISFVTSLLGVAFDTTLIALICGLPMMAIVYWLRASEAGFLRTTKERLFSDINKINQIKQN